MGKIYLRKQKRIVLAAIVAMGFLGQAGMMQAAAYTGELTNLNFGTQAGIYSGPGVLGTGTATWNTLNQGGGLWTSGTFTGSLFDANGIESHLTLTQNAVNSQWVDGTHPSDAPELMHSYWWRTDYSATLTITLGNLQPTTQYELVVFAEQPSSLTGMSSINVNGATWGSTAGGSLKLSDGNGVAYYHGSVVSDSRGDLRLDIINPGLEKNINGLQIQAVPAGNLFANWAILKGLNGSSGHEAGFTDDPDRDGISNGLEWILGGDPLQPDAAAIMPVAGGNSSTGLTFTFKREDASTSGSNLILQWNSDLMNPWVDVPVNETAAGTYNHPNGVTVVIEGNGASPDTVTVSIPAANGPAGRLFGRLSASLR